jgi:anti-anti-sigma factor
VQISHGRHGAADLVSIAGRLDSARSREAEETILAVLGEKPEQPLYVDCSGLEYISSAGLRVMLKAGKRLHENGQQLTLVGLTGPVARVFEMSGFDQLFPMQDELPVGGSSSGS